MALQLSQLSTIALVASDHAYFEGAASGHPLQSFPDNKPEEDWSFPTSLWTGAGETNALLQSSLAFDGASGFQAIAYHNWKVVHRFDEQSNDGFGAVLLRSTVQDDGKYWFVVAFQGTDGWNGKDWYANFDLARKAWEDNRTRVFDELARAVEVQPGVTVVPFSQRVLFTGQSLGGGLAQYAAYDYAFARQATVGGAASGIGMASNPLFDNEVAFNPTETALVTFNAFGGIQGLQNSYNGEDGRLVFDSELLEGVQTAHYAVENDVVHRLGEGHLNGSSDNTFEFQFRRFAAPGEEVPGPNNYLGIVESHRTEQGFYYGFDQYGGNFAGIPNVPGRTQDVMRRVASYGYLPTGTSQNVAALLSRAFSANTGASTPVAWGRVATGVLGVTLFGARSEVDTLVRLLVKNSTRSGDISEGVNSIVQAISPSRLGAFLVGVLRGGVVGGLTSLIPGELIELFNKNKSKVELDESIQFLEAILPQTTEGIPSLDLNIPDLSVPQDDRPAAAASRLTFLLGLQGGEALGVIENVTTRDKIASALLPLSGQSWDTASAHALAESMRGSNWFSDTVRYVASRTPFEGAALLDAEVRVARAFAQSIRYAGASDNAFKAVAQEQINTWLTTVSQEIVALSADFLVADGAVTSSAYGAIDALDDRAFREVAHAFLGAFADRTFLGGQLLPTDYMVSPAQANGALADGIATIRHAAQRPTFERFASKPSNPFDDSLFNADQSAPASGEMGDSGADTYVVFLPYEAGEGGQRIRLTLSGAGTDDVTVLSNGEVVAINAGTFELTVAEGRKQVSFALQAADDLGQDGTLSISATLVDAAGQATHQTHLEANITLDHEDATFAKTFDAAATTDFAAADRISGRFDDGGSPNDPTLTRTQLLGMETGDLVLGDHASESIAAKGGNDFIVEANAPSSGTYTEADAIDAGDGNDVVTGYLGRVEAGAGDDFVNPNNTLRLDASRLFDGGGTQPLGEVPGEIYADIAQFLRFTPVGTAPVANPDGSLDFQFTADFGPGSASGVSAKLGVVGTGSEASVERTASGGAAFNFSTVNGIANIKYLGGAEPLKYGVSFTSSPNAGNAQEVNIDGGAGNDLLAGAGGFDVIRGGTGNDRIGGYAGDDTLEGEDGNDLIIAGAGDDYIDAGAGDDQVWGEGEDDQLLGGTGNDVLHGDADVTPLVSQGHDYLDGGAGDDLLFGYGGDDELFGGEGVDQLAGDAGDDYLDGEGGNDLLEGGAGADTLFGGDGNDQLTAGEGDDYLDGEAGDDVMQAGAGNDTLFLGDGTDLAVGEDGDDYIDGGAGNDTFDAGAGNDTLIGGAGNDTLVGGAGKDTYYFYAGDGADKVADNSTGIDASAIVFGAGFDPAALKIRAGSLVLDFGDAGSVSFESFDSTDANAGTPFESLQFADGTTLEFADILNDIDGTAAAETLVGTDGSDRMRSLGGNDVVFGGLGNDFLYGGIDSDKLRGNGGDDYLQGGLGFDRLEGGAGNDTYLFDQQDTVLDSQGANRIVFGAGVVAEDLLVTGLNVSGQQVLLVNHTKSNSGPGLEILNATLASSTFSYEFADGQVLSHAELVQRAMKSGQTVGGAPGGNPGGSAPTTGTEGADTLVGTQLADTLQGLGGNDTLDGGRGNDLLDGGTGNDTYVLGWGTGRDTVVEQAGEASTIRLAGGMAFTDLATRREGNDLFVHTRRSEHGLVLKDYYAQPHSVQLATATGTTMALADFLASPAPAGDPVQDLWLARKTQFKNDWYAFSGPSSAQVLADGTLFTPPATATNATFTLTYEHGNFVGAPGGLTGAPFVTAQTSSTFGPGTVISSDLASQSHFVSNFGNTTNRIGVTYGVGWDAPAVTRTTTFVGTFTGSDQLLHPRYRTQATYNLNGTIQAVTAGQTGASGVDLTAAAVGGLPLPAAVNGNLDTNTATFNMVEVRGGSSSNTIQFQSFGLADGGAGDDLIDSTGGGTSFLTSQAAGNFLYGGAGDDRVTGSNQGDLIAGGTGNDLLAGWARDDTYYVFAGDAGVDIINEATRFIWEVVGSPRNAIDVGVNSRDTVEFGAGIAPAGLTLSWGSYVSRYTNLFTQTRAFDTLDIFWSAGNGVRVMMPDHTDPIVRGHLLSSPGSSWGVEQFKFADGTTLSLQDLLDSMPSQTFNGSAGSDFLNGTPGNDVFAGGAGADTLEGEYGNDLYRFGIGDGLDTINDVGGSDTVEFGLGIDQEMLSLGVESGTLVVRVGSGGDSLRLAFFDPNNAVNSASIETFEFADGSRLTREQLLARGFDHFGTEAAQTLNGSTSVTDRMFGFGGNDTLVAGAGDDVLDGGAGDDSLDGGSGADTMTGGVGNDTYTVDNAADAVVESAGEGTDLVRSAISYTLGDTLENLLLLDNGSLSGTGNALDNVITGNSFPNALSGLGGNDTLNGSSGEDVLDGGSGADNMIGGDGSDTYIVDQAGDVVNEAGTATGGLADHVFSSISYTVSDSVERLTLTGTADIDGFGGFFGATLTGNNGANRLEARSVGTGRANSLLGMGGNDTLIGREGDDLLDGGAGIDVMNGGIGSDTYVVDDSNDVVIEQTVLDPFKSDTVQSSAATYTLPVNVERLVLIGTADISATGNNSHGGTLIGNSGANVLTSLGASDVLDGGTGADVMIGGGGSDSFTVDNVGDVVIENPNEGTDSITTSLSYTLGANLENLTLTGSESIDGTGNELDNTITGNSGGNWLVGFDGNDWLDGAAEADVMVAGRGDDTYVVDNVGDAVFENVDEGTDLVRATISYTLKDHFENLTLLTFQVDGTGNALDNIITGNGFTQTLAGLAGNDRLIGNAGDDTLDGGTGVDDMSGGQGNDTFVRDDAGDLVSENANEGIDLVLSSLTYTLTDNVENLTLTGSADINGTGNVLNNRITGNGGLNVLTGLTGNDTYVMDNTVDIIVEAVNEGIDLVEASVTFTLTDNLENLTLTGTAAIDGTGNELDNEFRGNAAANSFTGRAGNDTYFIDSTADAVVESEGEGVDLVQSSVNYTLGAHVENLWLVGSAVSGTGNALANVITGSFVNNTLTGRGGDDRYIVQNTGDSVIEAANEGIDLVESSVTYTLSANVENLTLTGSSLINGTGNELANVIRGNSNNNTLTGGLGADAMFGGLGNDRYVVDNVDDQVNENANEGTDTVETFISYILGDTVENLTLIGFNAINGTGNALANVITGNGSDNILSGLDGNDTLNGTGGNDTLDGGSGNDTMSGSLGDDTYVVDSSLDGVTESAGQGTDLVRSSVTYALTVNVENLVLTGVANINGTGNSLNNSITGNDGDNRLDGGVGADAMDGGIGNDTYVIDNAADTVTDSAGLDLVESSITYTLGGSIENLTLTGAANLGGTGNALGNVVTGNGAANTLDGAAGNDVLVGGEGGDSYRFNLGTGMDAVEEVDAQANDTDLVLLGGGITTTNLLVSRTGQDMVLRVDGTNDRLTIRNWFASTGNRIEQARFADGTIWDAAMLESFALPSNSAPELSAAIADQQASEDAAFAFALPAGTFTDPNEGDTLTYSAQQADGSALPDWLSFDAGTRTFSGTPLQADVGSVDVRVTATDSEGLSAADVFTIGVANTNDDPTVANAMADQAAAEDSAFVFTVPADTFADEDPGDTLTWSATQAGGEALPGWLSFDTVNRVFSGTPTTGASYDLRVTATDAAGATAADVFHLEVANVNDAPVVAAPIGERSFTANTTSTFAVPVGTFFDEDGDTLTYSAALFGGGALPSWLTFNAATATFTGTPVTEDIGISHVAVTATDPSGAGVVSDFGLIVRATPGSTVRGDENENVLYGNTGDETIFGEGDDDALFGGAGDDILRGETGNDVLQGEEGNDVLRAGNGDNVLDGGSGDDLIFDGSGDSFISGGAGNDTIKMSTGNDVISFNSGDGWDTIIGGGDGGNTLSFGGGIRYSDLSFSKSGNDLVVSAGENQGVILNDWYAGSQSVLNLQIILDATNEFDGGSSDPLFNRRVQTFSFAGLVSSFDQARAASPGLTSWDVTNALLAWHLWGADDAALGGDLAYWYGNRGMLRGISLQAAQQVIGAPGFGSDAQTLRPFSGLQEGFVKLV